MKYSNTYYNLFKKEHTVKPPIFNEEENYIMRFNSKLSYYPYNGNSLTIIYFKEGTGSLILENSKRKICNNEFIIATPNTNWEYINNNNKSIDVLSFVLSEELLAKFNFFSFATDNKLLDNPFGTIKTNFFFDKQTFNASHYKSGKILNQIYDYSNSDNYALSSAKEVAFMVLENIFNEQLKAHKLSDKIKAVKKSTRVEVLKRLLIAYEYIHDNLGEQITIKELSLISRLSEYHLYHSFKRVFGKTPHQYINFHRMQKAKEMLERGFFTVTEVAFLLNFPNLATFSKLYKKTYGISPSLLGK